MLNERADVKIVSSLKKIMTKNVWCLCSAQCGTKASADNWMHNCQRYLYVYNWTKLNKLGWSKAHAIEFFKLLVFISNNSLSCKLKGSSWKWNCHFCAMRLFYFKTFRKFTFSRWQVVCRNEERIASSLRRQRWIF